VNKSLLRFLNDIALVRQNISRPAANRSALTSSLIGTTLCLASSALRMPGTATCQCPRSVRTETLSRPALNHRPPVNERIQPDDS